MRGSSFQPQCVFFAGLLVILGISMTHAQDQAQYFVDPNVRFVQLEGWGTSLAWFGDLLGGMDEDVIKEITSGLFSPSRLNFNIVRYTIGGTSPGNYTCGPYRAGGATESYKDGFAFDYNWERDPRQRRILQEAKLLGVDTFEAFSNSPPHWLTIAECSKGNDGGGIFHVNFDLVNADAYAAYVADVIEHFHEHWDITFQTYAPFNEPSTGGWFGTGQRQEGCNFDKPGMLALLQSLSNTFETRNMDYISLTAFDETMVNVELASQNWLRDEEMSHLISKVNTHGYWDLDLAQRDRLHSASVRDGHRLWMDEIGWAESPPENMTQGLIVANRIVNDLRQMLPSAWLYWQAMENTTAWGLVSIPYENPTLENVQYNSGYYTMMQFSKYLRKGFELIHINNDKAVAGHDASTKTLVIVIVNSDASVTKSGSIDLTPFSSLGTRSNLRTSSTEQNKEIEKDVPVVEKRVNYEAPPASVTTIVILNAEVALSPTNLIPSGDFEFGENPQSGWQTDNVNGQIVSSIYVRTGTYSGTILPVNPGESVSLTYTMEAVETKTYYLTAWCAGGGSTTAVLGVEVNDAMAQEVQLVTNPGYHVYGVQFQATAGNSVKIYFKASDANIESHIDDVILHAY